MGSAAEPQVRALDRLPRGGGLRWRRRADEVAW